MADYESEHSIPKSAADTAASSRRRRPDLSTFFSNLEHVDTSHSNTSTLPNPAHVTSAYRQLANTYQIMLGETSGVTPSASSYASDTIDNPLVAQMAELMMRFADEPPATVERVPDSFFDELERVGKKELEAKGKDASCPICSVPFLEDKYPLVVKLPCHKDHIFDLDCIRPWLCLNVTCPLDRKRLIPEKKESKEDQKDIGRRLETGGAAVNADEDEDDMGGMYG